MENNTTQRSETMTYSRACEILGLTTPKGVTEQARLAATYLATLLPGAPLRYSVACSILIEARQVTTTQHDWTTTSDYRVTIRGKDGWEWAEWTYTLDDCPESYAYEQAADELAGAAADGLTEITATITRIER